MVDAQSFDTHVSLARVLTGNSLSISIKRSEGNGSEFVSSEVFFCFDTVSGDVGVASTIASLVWSTSL